MPFFIQIYHGSSHYTLNSHRTENTRSTLTAHSQTKSTLIFEAIFWSNPQSILGKFGRFPEAEAEAKTADPRCHRGLGLGLGRSLNWIQYIDWFIQQRCTLAFRTCFSTSQHYLLNSNL